MGKILLAYLKERGYVESASFPVSDHPNSLEHSIASFIEDKKRGKI